MSEDEKFDEAREALLELYSSKSTLQATIILSLTIAFFTFIQAINNNKLFQEWNNLYLFLFYSFVLTAFVFLAIRAFGRLFYYARMGIYVERLKIISEEDLKRKIKEKDFLPTYLHRVEYSCDTYIGDTSGVSYIFNILTRKRWAIILTCPILFTGFFAYYLISNLIIIVIMVYILAFLALEAYLSWLGSYRMLIG
jgi:hypothetical protein